MYQQESDYRHYEILDYYNSLLNGTNQSSTARQWYQMLIEWVWKIRNGYLIALVITVNLKILKRWYKLTSVLNGYLLNKMIK